MPFAMKLMAWAIATGAIWLIYDHARAIISSDVLRALVATGVVIVGMVLAIMAYAAVTGYLRARGH